MEQGQVNLLYVDTDSIVSVHRPGQLCPPTGNFLGDQTSELAPGQDIQEFVSSGKPGGLYKLRLQQQHSFSGPKSYANHTNDLKTVCKIKGVTLNEVTERVLKTLSRCWQW